VKDMADPTCGSTVALCAPALIRPSGTFSLASAWEKGKENERRELKLAPMGLRRDDSMRVEQEVEPDHRGFGFVVKERES